MVFITAGMGGGTGTGAAPVIARMARERGVLTVGVVTKPFTFEGGRRAKAADAGIAELQQYVDTLIVIPNQNLFRLANERTGWKEAFKMADHVLYMGVRGVTDLMVAPGLVNLDFADIRTVMAEMGKAMMGTGEADGENRAIRAAEAAISNPLLEDTSMAGARGLLINITGGEDMTLFEVDQAANRIREEVAEDANIIFGSAIDESLAGRVRVSVVATGIDTPAALQAARRRSDPAWSPSAAAVAPTLMPAAAAQALAAQAGTAAPDAPRADVDAGGRGAAGAGARAPSRLHHGRAAGARHGAGGAGPPRVRAEPRARRPWPTPARAAPVPQPRPVAPPTRRNALFNDAPRAPEPAPGAPQQPVRHRDRGDPPPHPDRRGAGAPARPAGPRPGAGAPPRARRRPTRWDSTSPPSCAASPPDRPHPPVCRSGGSRRRTLMVNSSISMAWAATCGNND